MPIQAQSADGQIHEFPDGTSGAVIDRAMRQYAMERRNAPQPEPTPTPEAEPSWGDTAAFLGKRALTSALSIPGAPADVIGLVARNLPETGSRIPLIGPAVALEQARPGTYAPFTSDSIRGAIADYAPAISPREPQTEFERYGGAVADFAGGAAPLAGAGVIPSTARALAVEGGAAVTGGLGQEAARDVAPDNPYAPIVGGIAGSILNPTALVRAPGQIVRGALRGGERGRRAVNEAVDAFREFGSSPTVGQAAPETGIGRVLESVWAKSPGGAHVMLDKFREQVEKAGKYVNDLTTKTAGVNVSYNDAGRAIELGAPQFRSRYDKVRTHLEEQFNKMVPRDTVFLAPQYEKALGELTGVAQGFPNTQRTVQNAFVRQLADDFRKDAKGGVLSLEALRGIRTRIGLELEQASLKPDVDTGSMKKLYAALTRDIEDIATEAGPQARAAWDRAMRVEREGAQRLERVLDPLVKNRTIEQIQSAVAKLDGTRANVLMRSLTPDQQRIVASSLLEDMGRAKPANQVSADFSAGAPPEFSFETFMTNAKTMRERGMLNAVYGRPETAALRDGLDSLIVASSRAKEAARYLGNPPQTARAGMAQVAMYSMFTAPFDPSLTAAASMFTGFYLAPNTAARLFRSPRFVEWLGKSTKMKPEEVAGHVARLAVIAREDPSLAEPIREYTNALRAQVGAPRSERTQ